MLKRYLLQAIKKSDDAKDGNDVVKKQKAANGGAFVLLSSQSFFVRKETKNEFRNRGIVKRGKGSKKKAAAEDDDGETSVADSTGLESVSEFPREKLFPFLRELELDVFLVTFLPTVLIKKIKNKI